MLEIEHKQEEEPMELVMKRPTLRRVHANRPCSSSDRKCAVVSTAKFLRANACIIQSQFSDHAYLHYGQLVAERYVQHTSRDESDVILPDVVIALCVSYSFAPHDYMLCQLTQFLSTACKLWNAKKRSISKKILLTLIARFLMKHHGKHSNECAETEAVRYYDDLLGAELIVLVSSANVSYIAISELSVVGDSGTRSTLNYYSFIQ